MATRKRKTFDPSLKLEVVQMPPAVYERKIAAREPIVVSEIT